MLGIPEAPTAHFPESARAVILTTQALGDTELVPKLVRLLGAGATAFISQPLAHRLNGDPRLPTPGAARPGERSIPENDGGGGGSWWCSRTPAALDAGGCAGSHRATHARTPRRHWKSCGADVSDFTVTSLDAPPRVAVYPLGGRVAVVNYTELPVACHLTGLAGMAHRLTQIYALDGAALAPTAPPCACRPTRRWLWSDRAIVASISDRRRRSETGLVQLTPPWDWPLAATPLASRAGFACPSRLPKRNLICAAEGYAFAATPQDKKL